VLVESDRPDGALAAFRGAGPVDRWRPPPYFRVLSWVAGSIVAIGLGQREDVEFFSERMAEERGRQGVTGAGNASYFGPVELHLGRAAAFLGRWDDAESDLRAAAEQCRAMGASGFAVEADCELAHVLARRDADAARALATRTRAEAARLGMAPWARRAAALLSTIGLPEALSRRELGVARLVTEGKTNRAIAEELFMSERTAQTHVQHILTKLGLSNRTQIAAWMATQRQEQVGEY